MGELEELERLNFSRFSNRSKKEKVMSVYTKCDAVLIKNDIFRFVNNELKISVKTAYLRDNKAKISIRRKRFDIKLIGELGMSHEKLRERVQQKVGDNGVVIFSPIDEEIRDQNGGG